MPFKISKYQKFISCSYIELFSVTKLVINKIKQKNLLRFKCKFFSVSIIELAFYKNSLLNNLSNFFKTGTQKIRFLSCIGLEKISIFILTWNAIESESS